MAIDKEFTLVSVHNHFGGPRADCTIDQDVDSTVPRFDISAACDLIDDAAANGYTLLGQTNSNHLDSASFYLLQEYASAKKICLLPGIELCLQNWENEEQFLHVVVLFDPALNLYKIENAARAYVQANGEFFFKIDQFSELLMSGRSIMFIHGVKQKRDGHSLSKNPEMAAGLLSLAQFTPVAIEDNQSYHKLSLEKEIKAFISNSQVKWLSKVAASVSTMDRTEGGFAQIKAPTLIWASNSFDDLYYAVLVGGRRIMKKADVSNKTSYVSRIVIRGGKGMQDSDIRCSHGMNSIIGHSGSGKTLLLDILKRKLTGMPLENKTISNDADYTEIYSPAQITLYDGDGNEIADDMHYEVVEGENLYQKIIRVYSNNDNVELLQMLGISIDRSGYDALISNFNLELNQYLQLLREEKTLRANVDAKSASAASAKKFINANAASEAASISYTIDPNITKSANELNDRIAILRKDRDDAEKHFDAVSEIIQRDNLDKVYAKRIKALKEDIISELDSRIESLSILALDRRQKEAANKLIYDAAQEYNSLVSRQAEQVNKRCQTYVDSLSEMATDVLKIMKIELCSHAPTLSKEDLKNSVVMQSSNDGLAKLAITSVDVSVAVNEDLKDAFPTNIGRKPKINASGFSAPYDLSNEESTRSLVSVFLKEDYQDLLSFTRPFANGILYKIQLLYENSYRDIEDLSAGTLAKLYVLNFFDKAITESGSNTIVLYDQPDSNMEKSFILDKLATKFNELRMTHQLFIATHEPLLVVNADSNQIILATNDKKVTQENSVLYENKSITGAGNRHDVVEEIAKMIDGSDYAVKQRSNIYEGMINDQDQSR